MAKVYVSYQVQETATPTGRIYASTKVVLTDAAGGVQTAPASTITMPDGSAAAGAVFDVVAPGAGSFVVQVLDTMGDWLSNISGTFVIPPAALFPSPVSSSATVVP